MWRVHSEWCLSMSQYITCLFVPPPPPHVTRVSSRATFQTVFSEFCKDKVWVTTLESNYRR